MVHNTFLQKHMTVCTLWLIATQNTFASIHPLSGPQGCSCSPAPHPSFLPYFIISKIHLQEEEIYGL